MGPVVKTPEGIVNLVRVLNRPWDVSDLSLEGSVDMGFIVCGAFLAPIAALNSIISED